MRRNVFAWIALGTCLALLIPVMAMRFSDEVNWGAGDFIVMGLLLFGTGSLLAFASRCTTSGVRRIAVCSFVVLGFVYVWAELAVGILTDLGS